MLENTYVTISELSETLSIGRDTINEHIARLKKDNRLKRVGGRKEGHWEVLEDDTDD